MRRTPGICGNPAPRLNIGLGLETLVPDRIGCRDAFALSGMFSSAYVLGSNALPRLDEFEVALDAGRKALVATTSYALLRVDVSPSRRKPVGVHVRPGGGIRRTC